MKNFIVGALIIGVALIIGFGIVSKNVNLGVSPGPEHYSQEYFYGGIVEGGGIYSASFATSVSITAANICDNNVVKLTSTGAANSSTTFPTAANLIARCFQKDGDTKNILFWNGNALATATQAFIAGTGDILFFPEVTAANGVIAGYNIVNMRFTRASSTGMFINISEAANQ